MPHPRAALVTGGNRGIGLEVCRQLVGHGRRVLLACRDVDSGRAAASTLLHEASAPTGADIVVLPLDTGDADSIQALAQKVAADYDQQVDILVMNAGILVSEEWSREAYDRTLAVNTAGPCRLADALLPHLAPGALIVAVSSTLGCKRNLSPDYAAAVGGVTDWRGLQDGTPPFDAASTMGTAPPGSGAISPTYSVSKALLNRAVQLMAGDAAFAERGIRVASTCPGWCRTDMGTTAADRSAAEGASSILWPWLHWSNGLQGSFTRDGEQKEW